MYRINPATGERELVVTITRGTAQASSWPGVLLLACIVALLAWSAR